LFAVGLHTYTAVARSLCVSWALLFDPVAGVMSGKAGASSDADVSDRFALSSAVNENVTTETAVARWQDSGEAHSNSDDEVNVSRLGVNKFLCFRLPSVPEKTLVPKIFYWTLRFSGVFPSTLCPIHIYLLTYVLIGAVFALLSKLY